MLKLSWPAGALWRSSLCWSSVIGYGLRRKPDAPTPPFRSSSGESHGPSDSSWFPEQPAGITRDELRRMLLEMESNVPHALQEIEDDLPDAMAEFERMMIRDAHKYGLSPSEMRDQLREIEADARRRIWEMEDDLKHDLLNMEDAVWEELQRDEAER